MSERLKLKLLGRSTLKGKVGVHFPASVTALSPIEVDQSGNTISIGIDMDALIDQLPVSAVSGPGSSTDNAIVRWNGVGGDSLQNSSPIINDDGNLFMEDGMLSLRDAGGGGDLSQGMLWRAAPTDGPEFRGFLGFTWRIGFEGATEVMSLDGRGLTLPEMTAPVTVATDHIGIYAKNVGGVSHLFTKDEAGTETDLNTAGGGGTPGGANTQIQFNDGGAFGGDADFTWNKTTNQLAFPAATGSTIDWASGDVTITHTANTLTVSGASAVSIGIGGELTVGTIQLGALADTTLSRLSPGVMQVEGVTVLTALTGQPLDADLTALAALASTGLIARTGAGTVAARTITGPASGISIANGDGVAGNPTLSLTNDLNALEGLAGTNTIYYRSAADTWSPVTIGANLTFITGTLSASSGSAVVGDGDYTDITVSGVGTVWTIDNDVVTNVKLANMADATIKGRALGAGSGDPTDLTATQVMAIIQTVDGAGSGLDADLLDGNSSAFYATATDISNHLGDTSDAHDASAISFVPAGNIAAIDVQAAIAELDGEKQPLDADLTSWALITRASGFDTFVATPTSTNLAALVTGETGTGSLVFNTSPSFTTPLLGTPTSGTLTNCAGLPTVLVANEATDTTCFVNFTTAAGAASPGTELGIKTNASLTFNSNTGVLSVGGSAVITTTTGAASLVTVANEATDATCFVGFYTAATGDLGPKSNANMTFNSATGVVTFASSVLTSTDINGGTIDGTTIGAATPSSATFTTAVANSFVPNSSTVPSNGMYLPAANTLGWAINTAAELQLTGTALSPAVDGGSSLGTTALGWQNLFGNTGFVWNIENGDWVATHTTGVLTVGTGDLRVTTAGTNAASVVTTAGTQTFTNKTFNANGTGNSITNIETPDIAVATLVTAADTIATNNNDTTWPTTAAVIAYSQPLDSDLTAFAGLATTGLVTRTGAGTAAARTIIAPAAGITVTNGDGVAGNPTLVLANDLAALEALAGTDNIYYRSGADTWSSVTIGANLTFTGGTLAASSGTATVGDGDYGDIVVSGVGTVWTIDTAAVTYAKIQDVSAASRLLGRGDSGAGDVEEITIGAGLSMTGTTLSSTGGYTTEQAQDDVGGILVDSTTIDFTYNDATPSITAAVIAVPVANEATDATCFLGFFTAASGDLAPKTNTNMTFNSATGVATFASTVLTTTDINGGTLDGTVIGGASAAAATVTTLTVNTNANPDADDGAALGTGALGWSDLFLADGGVINWGNGGVTQTHTAASDSLTLSLDPGNALASTQFSISIDGTSELVLTGTALSPGADGGSSLGTTALGWQNLFGNSGFIINIEAGDWVATHTTGILTVGTGDLRVTTAGTNTASVVTVGGTQTLTNKTFTSPVLTTPQINDTSSDHQYVFAVSELVADRTVTLPLLTAGDTFVFEAHAQTLSNKSLTSPTITGTPTAAGATWTNLGTVTTADINGGTLDGTVIGGASAAAATVTTLTSQTHLPALDGTYDLGSTTLAWNNLHLDTGATINIENGNWVATHTTGILTVGTGDLRVTTAGTNTASVVTVGGTQTLTGKSISLTTNTLTGTAAEFNTAITGADFYTTGGTDVALADGGTGASLTAPTVDRLLMWDQGGTTVAFGVLGNITTHASPVTGDFVLVQRQGTDDLVKVDWASLPGAGGGAPSTASYLTLSLDGTLSAERVLTAGNGIAFVDGGANTTLTISADAASTSVDGIVQLSTTTEVLTGTATDRANTPDSLAALWEKGAAVASATTTTLGEGGYFHITGTTTITDIDFATAKDGRTAIVQFDAALTLTHNATTLVLPGGASITTAAGDCAIVVQDATDNIKVVDYFRASGLPLDPTLAALGAYNTNGLLTQTAADTFTGRTVTGTASRISVSNGSGVAGNPTIDIDAAYVGQSTITTVGTITTGVWTGTDIALANIVQGTARSVLGVTGNATADYAPIQGSTSQVLRVNAANTALAFQSSAALTKTDDTNVTLTLGGTPTTALLDATSLTLGWTGTLAVGRGGIGVGTITGLMQGNGTSAVTGITNSSTVGQVLRVTGASTYAWGALDLADADAITGDLPYGNFTAASAASLLLGRGSAAAGGDWQEVTLGTGLAMTGTVLSATGGGGGINNVVEDLTPQLGGDLDVNGFDITSAADIVIDAIDTIELNGGITNEAGGQIASAYGNVPGVQFSAQADGIQLALDTWNAGANSGYLALTHSRSSTRGTHALLSNADEVGQIVFAGSDGTNFENAAAIFAYVDGTAAANDMPGRLSFQTTPDATTALVEAVRIDNVGRFIMGNTASVTICQELGNNDSPAFQIHGITASAATMGFYRWDNSTTPARFSIGKCRSAIVGDHTGGIVSSGNDLGAITFGGSDGTEFEPAAAIVVAVDGTPSTTSMPGRLEFRTTPSGLAVPANRLTIDNAGVITVEAGGYLVAAAQTATTPAIQLTSSATLQTTPLDGSIEMDANCFYGCTDAGNRGYIPVRHFIRANATRTLPNDTNENAIFNSPASGTLTLEIGTYFFEMLIYVTTMSGTSGNALIDLKGAGTASTGAFLWHYTGTDSASTTTVVQPATWQSGIRITQDTEASIVTAGTGVTLAFYAKGTFEVTSGGTMIPSIDQVTAAAAVVQIGSYFACERIGSDAVVSVGQWT